MLEEEIAALMLRTDVGDATYLAGHTPLVGSIVPGLVRVQHEDGTEERLAVHGGFVHVKSDGVTVLAPVAEREQDIDVERARRALEAAEQAVAEAAGPRLEPRARTICRPSASWSKPRAPCCGPRFGSRSPAHRRRPQPPPGHQVADVVTFRRS